MANDGSGHFVAVIGGATAGAEVASRLADKGVNVFVFEQNARPYGKIEDGLPRWHVALRNKEYGVIDEKLQKQVNDPAPMAVGHWIPESARVPDVDGPECTQ